jgi:hypothetical protein
LELAFISLDYLPEAGIYTSPAARGKRSRCGEIRRKHYGFDPFGNLLAHMLMQGLSANLSEVVDPAATLILLNTAVLALWRLAHIGYGCVCTRNQDIEKLNRHLLVYRLTIYQLVQPRRPVIEPWHRVWYEPSTIR